MNLDEIQTLYADTITKHQADATLLKLELDGRKMVGGSVGVCTVCGFYRNSRLCTCFERVRNRDPFHPLLADIETSIRDNKYFGQKAYEAALECIQAARQSFLSDYAGPNNRHSDGWDIKKIDEQAKRLVQIAKGKLFGIRRRFAERGDAPREQNDGLTNLQRLKALQGKTPSNVRMADL